MNRGACTTNGLANDIGYSFSSPNKFLRIIFWIAAPILIWWILKDFSLREIGEHLRRFSMQAIVMLILLNAIITLIYSSRWWLILRTQGHQRSYLALAGYRLAAFGIAYFTPGPQFGGEPLQVHLLQKREHISTTTAIASITLDKLIELLINFSFLLAGVMVILFSGVLKGDLRIEMLILPVGLLIFPSSYLLALKYDRQPVSWLSAWLAGHLNGSIRLKQVNHVINAAEGQVARFCQLNSHTLLISAVMSILIWGLMIFEFSLMLRFLGVQVDLAKALIALTTARLAFLMPMPAGLGLLEAGQVMAMGLIGVNPALGVSLSLLIRLRDVILGGLGLWLGGVLSRQ